MGAMKNHTWSASEYKSFASSCPSSPSFMLSRALARGRGLPLPIAARPPVLAEKTKLTGPLSGADEYRMKIGKDDISPTTLLTGVAALGVYIIVHYLRRM